MKTEDIAKLSINELHNVIRLSKEEILYKSNKRKIDLQNKKHQKFINKFGKKNFDEFKTIFRKINNTQIEDVQDVVRRRHITIDFYITNDFKMGAGLIDENFDDIDISDDDTIKKSEKSNIFMEEMETLLNKYQKICKNKKITFKNLVKITEEIISEDEKAIKSIIE